MLAGSGLFSKKMKVLALTNPVGSKMVFAGVFVPHQLLAALSVLDAVPRLARLLPAAAELPASRLKFITSWLEAAPEPAAKTPPPQLLTQAAPSAPVAVFPVIVTLERVVVSLVRLLHNPPPWSPVLPVIFMAPPALSTIKPWPLDIPPPCP